MLEFEPEVVDFDRVVPQKRYARRMRVRNTLGTTVSFTVRAGSPERWSIKPHGPFRLAAEDSVTLSLELLLVRAPSSARTRRRGQPIRDVFYVKSAFFNQHFFAEYLVLDEEEGPRIAPPPKPAPQPDLLCRGRSASPTGRGDAGTTSQEHRVARSLSPSTKDDREDLEGVEDLERQRNEWRIQAEVSMRLCKRLQQQHPDMSTVVEAALEAERVETKRKHRRLLHAKDQQIANLEKEVATQHAREETLEIELKETCKRLDAVETELTTSSHIRADLEKEVARCHERDTTVATQLRDTSEQATLYEIQLTEARQELTGMRERERTLRRQVEDFVRKEGEQKERLRQIEEREANVLDAIQREMTGEVVLPAPAVNPPTLVEIEALRTRVRDQDEQIELLIAQLAEARGLREGVPVEMNRRKEPVKDAYQQCTMENVEQTEEFNDMINTLKSKEAHALHVVADAEEKLAEMQEVLQERDLQIQGLVSALEQRNESSKHVEERCCDDVDVPSGQHDDEEALSNVPVDDRIAQLEIRLREQVVKANTASERAQVSERALQEVLKWPHTNSGMVNAVLTLSSQLAAHMAELAEVRQRLAIAGQEEVALRREKLSWPCTKGDDEGESEQLRLQIAEMRMETARTALSPIAFDNADIPLDDKHFLVFSTQHNLLETLRARLESLVNENETLRRGARMPCQPPDSGDRTRVWMDRLMGMCTAQWSLYRKWKQCESDQQSWQRRWEEVHHECSKLRIEQEVLQSDYSVATHTVQIMEKRRAQVVEKLQEIEETLTPSCDVTLLAHELRAVRQASLLMSDQVEKAGCENDPSRSHPVVLLALRREFAGVSAELDRVREEKEGIVERWIMEHEELERLRQSQPNECHLQAQDPGIGILEDSLRLGPILTELESLRGKYDASEKEMEDLQMTWESERQALEQVILAAENQVASLRRQVETEQDTIEEMTQELATQREIVTNERHKERKACAERQAAEKRATVAEAEASQLGNALALAREERSSILCEENALRIQVAELQTNMEQSTEEASRVVSTLNGMIREVGCNTLEEVGVLVRQLRENVKREHDLNTRVLNGVRSVVEDQWGTRIPREGDPGDVVKALLDGLQTGVAAQHTLMQELRQELDATKATLATSRETHAQDVQMRDQALEEATMRMRGLEMELGDTQSQVHAYEKAEDQASRRLQEANEGEHYLQNRVKDLETTLAQFQHDFTCEREVWKKQEFSMRREGNALHERLSEAERALESERAGRRREEAMYRVEIAGRAAVLAREKLEGERVTREVEDLKISLREAEKRMKEMVERTQTATAPFHEDDSNPESVVTKEEEAIRRDLAVTMDRSHEEYQLFALMLEVYAARTEARRAIRERDAVQAALRLHPQDERVEILGEVIEEYRLSLARANETIEELRRALVTSKVEVETTAEVAAQTELERQDLSRSLKCLSVERNALYDALCSMGRGPSSIQEDRSCEESPGSVGCMLSPVQGQEELVRLRTMEVGSLRKMIEDRDRQIDALVVERRALQDEIERLSEQCHVCKAAQKEAEERLTAAREESSRVRAALHHAGEDWDSDVVQIRNELIKSRQDAQARSDTLQQQVSFHIERIAREMGERGKCEQELNASLDAANRELSHLAQALDAAQRKQEDMNHQHTLEQEEWHRTFLALERGFEQFRDQQKRPDMVHEGSQSAAPWCPETSILQGRIAALEQRSLTLEQECDVLEKEAQATRMEACAAENARHQMILEKEEQVKQAHEEAEQLKKEIEHTRETMRPVTDVQRLEGTVHELQDALKVAKDEIARKSRLIVGFRGAQEEREKEIRERMKGELEEKVRKMTRELARKDTTLRDLRGRLEDVQRAGKEREDQFRALESRTRHMTAEATRREILVKEMRGRLDETKGQLASSTQRAQEAEQESFRLSEAIHQGKTRIERLECMIQSARTERGLAETALEESKAEITATTTRIQEEQGRSHALRTVLLGFLRATTEEIRPLTLDDPVTAAHEYLGFSHTELCTLLGGVGNEGPKLEVDLERMIWEGEGPLTQVEDAFRQFLRAVVRVVETRLTRLREHETRKTKEHRNEVERLQCEVAQLRQETLDALKIPAPLDPSFDAEMEALERALHGSTT